eukprot:5414852-Pleurochrysis_carterae.AAC.2
MQRADDKALSKCAAKHVVVALRGCPLTSLAKRVCVCNDSAIVLLMTESSISMGQIPDVSNDSEE